MAAGAAGVVVAGVVRVVMRVGLGWLVNRKGMRRARS
jgi:hypothetical protein